MIIDLDAEAGLDPGRVGSKAAWLALGRRGGLPVLPGFVVESGMSRHHMLLGAEALSSRGSGGARLSIIKEPLPFAEELVDAGSRLAAELVARSSTTLEASGEWSGAFTSYLGLAPSELPQAVAGCWASAFSVTALDREAAASIEPGSVAMAVLVQPALQPEAGGTAEIAADGSVVVHGVKGSPAPLLQGWETGAMARWDGGWSGEGLIDLVGSSTLDSLAVVLRRARAGTGANRCEWAKDGEIWVLQLGETISRPPLIPASRIDTDVDPLLVALARTVVRAPGLLGEELVLPWALGGLPAVSARAASTDPDVPATRELSRQLVEEVWGLPADQAIQLAERTMRELRGPDPVVALDRLHGLKTPDARPTTTLLDMVDALRARMVEMGAAPTVSAAWHMSTGDIADVIEGRGHRTLTRAGIGRWEPFVASVVLATGSLHHGTAAAGGIGAGRRAQVSSGQGMEKFPPRAVVTSPGPTPDLAPLLWDASALVTGTGSPAAHLFDSARSLGIPAVCGVDIGEDPDLIVAVDGHRATVATMSMHGAEDD